MEVHQIGVFLKKLWGTYGLWLMTCALGGGSWNKWLRWVAAKRKSFVVLSQYGKYSSPRSLLQESMDSPCLEAGETIRVGVLFFKKGINKRHPLAGFLALSFVIIHTYANARKFISSVLLYMLNERHILS